MGLDITAYKNLTPAEGVTYDNEEGVFRDANGQSLGWESKYVSFYDNSDFPEHSNGITPDTPYTYEDSFSFRAGSYGGYNGWRNWLAAIAGYGSAQACWDKHTSGPFYELINFSDCEGTIGPVVATKLYEDFKNFDEKARAQALATDDYYYNLYISWRQAFELAAENGAVDFH